jgi:DNA-binding MarR family transcriptional regulator
MDSPQTARARRRRSDGSLAKERLRLWLRMLRASRSIETDLRERLRVTYAMTLPQFDVLAALARRDNGVTMTGLSRYLMVSNGNSTGIVERLVKDGLVTRSPVPGDRRATVVALSPQGRTSFAAMAAEHESWIDDLLDGFDRGEVASLTSQLDRLLARIPTPPRQAATSQKKAKPR